MGIMNKMFELIAILNKDGAFALIAAVLAAAVLNRRLPD